MRKITNVRRSRNDTQMWFVVHDFEQRLYEVWHVDPSRGPVDGVSILQETFTYEDVMESNDEVSARIQAKHLARDLSDAA